MSITRQKAKGRRGGEREPFAMLPESVLTHPALATAPHAALRVLTVLLVGKSKERNGTMMCSDSYAAKFGITSHDTLSRSLECLETRGLIETTRHVLRMRRIAALYAVTWWPIYYRNGLPLTTPEPAPHKYVQWNDAPTIGVESKLDSSPRLSGDDAPTIGVDGGNHHPDLPPKSTIHHPDYRGNSKNLGPGVGAAQGDSGSGEALMSAAACTCPHCHDAAAALADTRGRTGWTIQRPAESVLGSFSIALSGWSTTRDKPDVFIIPRPTTMSQVQTS